MGSQRKASSLGFLWYVHTFSFKPSLPRWEQFLRVMSDCYTDNWKIAWNEGWMNGGKGLKHIQKAWKADDKLKADVRTDAV